MPTGPALIEEINRYFPPVGEFGLWWLGQHGFALKLGRSVVYVDAFLTDMPQRLVPPLLRPEEVTNATLILGTHDHADHIDRDAWPAMAAASPQATFVVPELVRRKIVAELGLPAHRVVGLDDQTWDELSGIRITGIAAAHELLTRDAMTGHFPCLGYVIEGGGATIYHAGDCCIYEGLQTRLRPWGFDLMLLPINGRDAVRLSAGIIGNMTYQEAADLAGALGPAFTIPTHYEMFAANAADPKLFADYMRAKYPHLRVKLCAHGQLQVLPALGRNSAVRL